MAWEEVVHARFSHSSAPVIVNNTVYLTLNQSQAESESTIFAYDVSTGINKFIVEFPRNDNKMLLLYILDDYNNVSGDTTSIMVLTNNKINKGVMLLDALTGREKWRKPFNSFPILDGIEISAWENDNTKHIMLMGDQDFYTLNIESGDIVSEKRFKNRFLIHSWNNHIVHLDDKKIVLWDPMENRVWDYALDSKISNFDIIEVDSNYSSDDNKLLSPSIIVGTESGFLRALNFNGGWFSWNIERWVFNIGAAPKRIWTHNQRVFCLTEHNSLFTFDINSGKKINNILLDQNNYSRWYPDRSNNAIILANDEFIVGIDPLNGDQLWKIKEHKNKHIRPFDNNLLVTRSVNEDSIIIINNYNRDSGNLIWSEVLDRKKQMAEPFLNMEGLTGFDIGQQSKHHPALFYHIHNINDVPHLATRESIKEIDISHQQEGSSIELSHIKLSLARAYYSKNDLHSAMAEYNNLVKRYDQMSKDGHKELSALYINAGFNKKAVGSLLNYYNLLMPNSLEAHGTINKLKGITGLNWVINTSSSDKETYLMSDNNKIFHINNNIVEVYRAGLGAQLNRIKLGDNVERIVDVSVEDKNLMILIVRLELKEYEWGKDEVDMDAHRRDNTQYNLIAINKASGNIIFNNKMKIVPEHDIIDISIIHNKTFINSVFDDSLFLWHYNVNDGQHGWTRSFEMSSYYNQNIKLKNLFYNDTILLPYEDKIIYLDINTGETIYEFADEDVEEVVVCNKNGLVNGHLTIIVEDVGYEYITIDLDDDSRILSRGEFESNDPHMSALINNCFIDIQPMGSVASYCVDEKDGVVEMDWSVDLDFVFNYIGILNNNLILLDKDNNIIVELDAKSGKEKGVFPLLWDATQSNINNNLVIVRSDRKLYAITI